MKWEYVGKILCYDNYLSGMSHKLLMAYTNNLGCFDTSSEGFNLKVLAAEIPKNFYKIIRWAMVARYL